MPFDAQDDIDRREQLKQLVENRVSQFFTVDSYSSEGRGPFMVKFLGERVTYVGRTETERKPYQFRVSIRNVESTHENLYGLLVTSVEKTDATAERPGVVKSDR